MVMTVNIKFKIIISIESSRNGEPTVQHYQPSLLDFTLPVFWKKVNDK